MAFPSAAGLQHQGIFRVSGSQVEVNDIKNSFERGELVVHSGSRSPFVAALDVRSLSRPGDDPLIDEESNRDINSVAGVLKLYFRGLGNPLFPSDRFNDLIACIRECRARGPDFSGSKIWRLPIRLGAQEWRTSTSEPSASKRSSWGCRGPRWW